MVSGRWISPFTGKVIQNSSEIDIDHVVPLKWAWDHGANTWSRDKREKFANDPANLWSVELSLNRQKGAQEPEDWLPPLGKCQYLSRFKPIIFEPMKFSIACIVCSLKSTVVDSITDEVGFSSTDMIVMARPKGNVKVVLVW